MITTAQYSVDGTAVKLVATSQTPKLVTLHPSTTTKLYINGANTVTTSTGFLIDNAVGPFTFECGPNDEVWGICEAGTHTVTVLVITL